MQTNMFISGPLGTSRQGPERCWVIATAPRPEANGGERGHQPMEQVGMVSSQEARRSPVAAEPLEGAETPPPAGRSAPPRRQPADEEVVAPDVIDGSHPRVVARGRSHAGVHVRSELRRNLNSKPGGKPPDRRSIK
jgi:hypothetical protein